MADAGETLNRALLQVSPLTVSAAAPELEIMKVSALTVKTSTSPKVRVSDDRLISGETIENELPLIPVTVLLAVSVIRTRHDADESPGTVHE